MFSRSGLFNGHVLLLRFVILRDLKQPVRSWVSLGLFRENILTAPKENKNKLDLQKWEVPDFEEFWRKRLGNIASLKQEVKL